MCSDNFVLHRFIDSPFLCSEAVLFCVLQNWCSPPHLPTSAAALSVCVQFVMGIFVDFFVVCLF